MRNRMRGLLLVAAAGLGLALVAPSAARAGGDHFENGFKDELGRVAAHEAFGIGRHILAEVLLGGGRGGYGHGYQRPIHHQTYYRHGARYYDDYDRHDRHHYRHKRQHYRHDRHHYRHRRHHRGHRGRRYGCDH